MSLIDNFTRADTSETQSNVDPETLPGDLEKMKSNAIQLMGKLNTLSDDESAQLYALLRKPELKTDPTFQRKIKQLQSRAEGSSVATRRENLLEL